MYQYLMLKFRYKNIDYGLINGCPVEIVKAELQVIAKWYQITVNKCFEGQLIF